MPYCINCGVKLDDNLITCPLCGTPVIDPKTLRPRSENLILQKPVSEGSSWEISDILTQPLIHKVSQKTAAISTITLLIPIITTLVWDILTSNAITWSFYPILSMLYFWFAVFFPSLFKTGRRMSFILNFGIATTIYLLLLDGFIPPVTWAWYPMLGIGLVLAVIITPVFLGRRYTFPVIIVYTGAGSLFLWGVESLTGGYWFLTLALPIALLTGGAAILINGLYTLISRRPADGSPYRAAAVSAAIAAVYFAGVDIICTLYIPTRASIGWSYIPGGILLLLSVLLFITGGNRKLRSFLEKKFHA